MPIAHIAPAVVAVFVEAIDAGNLTAVDVVAVVGAAEFAKFQRLSVLRFQPEIQNLKSKFAAVSVVLNGRSGFVRSPKRCRHYCRNHQSKSSVSKGLD